MHSRAKDKWVCGDFLELDAPSKSYRTIVGNPPYARRGPTNLYLLFIEKCLGLLARGGELVFVLPSDFFHLTGAAGLLTSMCEQGAFTDIYRPNNERLFSGASIDVVVVRYQKTKGLRPECRDFTSGHRMTYSLDGGIVTFVTGEPPSGPALSSVATVHVGLVTGCEVAFQDDALGNVELLVGNGEKKRYIMASGPGDPLVDEVLSKHKDRLLARRIRRFDEHNWYEWGALRNIGMMRAREGQDCVYVSCLTRSDKPARLGKVGYFGAGLLCVVPKDGSLLDLPALVDTVNGDSFRARYTRSGRFRMGQRQLAHVRLPMPIA